jgi:hypothetical protein
VCVCVRERERERDKNMIKIYIKILKIKNDLNRSLMNNLLLLLLC